MSKSTFDFDPKQLATARAQFALESLNAQLDMLDWVKSLQWAIKDLSSDSTVLGHVRLKRITHLASASIYLTDEALTALRDDVELSQGGGEI